MSRKFYKTVITLEVLSEDEPVDNWDLENIVYGMDKGNLSGVVNTQDPIELSPAAAALALIEQGSDPEFFGLDRDGNEVF
jgi:hypothetical protein